jgi:hypothetical protein
MLFDHTAPAYTLPCNGINMTHIITHDLMLARQIPFGSQDGHTMQQM